MPIEPLAIGVCSWSLQVKSIPELKRLMDRLGVWPAADLKPCPFNRFEQTFSTPIQRASTLEPCTTLFVPAFKFLLISPRKRAVARRRHSDGAMANARRNASLKWLWLAKPKSSASTVKSVSPWSRRSSAVRNRKRSRYWWIGSPVSRRNTRAR